MSRRTARDYDLRFEEEDLCKDFVAAMADEDNRNDKTIRRLVKKLKMSKVISVFRDLKKLM